MQHHPARDCTEYKQIQKISPGIKDEFCLIGTLKRLPDHGGISRDQNKISIYNIPFTSQVGGERMLFFSRLPSS